MVKTYVDLSYENKSRLSSQNADEIWQTAIEGGSRISFRIASSSMMPTLRPGDRVIIERFPPARNPRLGDIVLMRIVDKWVVHRIVGRVIQDREVYYRQKGDAGRETALVSSASISGRAVAIEKMGGDTVELTSRRQIFLNAFLGRFFCLIDALRRYRQRPGGIVDPEKFDSQDESVPIGNDVSRIRLVGAYLLVLLERRVSGACARLIRGVR